MAAHALTRTLNRTSRRALPYGLALLLILFLRLPFQAEGLEIFIPHIGLIFTFYWAIYRPDQTPFWAVFLLGLFEDLISLSPVGLTPLLLLSLVAALHNQRRFFVHRPFAVTWGGFAIVAILAFGIIWMLTSFHERVLLSPLPLLAQMQVTILVFPPIAWLFARCQRFL